MTDDQKRGWDAYDVLRKAASERFAERRKFEYRVLMSFWAAIAALTVLLLRQEVREWHREYSWAAIVLACLSFLAWYFWTAGLNRAHAHDRDVSRFFEDAMMKIVGLEIPDDIKKQATKLKRRKHFLRYWSHQLQLAITALLLIAFALVAWTKKEPNKAPEPTTMAVTPRASARAIEMKPQNPNRHAARGAPATVVAHL